MKKYLKITNEYKDEICYIKTDEITKIELTDYGYKRLNIYTKDGHVKNYNLTEIKIKELNHIELNDLLKIGE